MEIADVFVLNKADREGADRTYRDLAMVLSLADGMTEATWLPPIVKTVAARGEGIERAARRRSRSTSTGCASGAALDARRRAQLKLRVETILKDRVLAAASAEAGLEAEVERGFARHVDPYRLADALFDGVVRAEAARVGARGGGRMIRRVDHLGIAVRSIAEARGFYEALGLDGRGDRGGAAGEGPGGDDPLRRDAPRAARADRPGLADRPLPRAARPRHPPRLPGQRRPRRRRPHACAGAAPGCCASAPTAGAGGARVQFVHPKSAGGVLVELAQGGHGE